MNIQYNMLIIATLLIACGPNHDKADGYGNFESTEITVSAQGNGALKALHLQEGEVLAVDQPVGYIDTLHLALKKAQLVASREAIRARSAGVLSQVDVYEAQRKKLNVEKHRVEALLQDSAATQRQLDDITGQLDVVAKQIRSVRVQNAAVFNELQSMEAQIKQVEDQLQKSIVTNPVNGTVLVKYAEEGEVVAFGKPLYKVADLQHMILRVYVAEPQLPALTMGQTVTVRVDAGHGTWDMPGTIRWISSSAEFTPKIIQTKEERVNLVYAVKVAVPNPEGRLKIGMPGEMWMAEATDKPGR